jgi:hypothetical protein
VKGRQPNPLSESLTRRQKRVFALAGGLALVVLAAIGTWSLSDPGSYGRSQHGCINVVMPSTTGAGTAHGCGGTAQAMCQRAYAGHDRLARLTRVQCKRAGIGPRPARRAGMDS